jgi:Flp pilus assembly pilin Flp
MRSWFVEFVIDDAGQDLIEYALLGATIGLAGAVAFGLMRTAMGTTYTSWGNAVQSDALVVMPDPGQ